MADDLIAASKEEAKRAAQRARSRKWYLANRELAITRAAAYYASNKESILAKQRADYPAKREVVQATNRRWKEANPERYQATLKAASKRWKKNNPERVKEQNRRDCKSPRRLATLKKWRALNPEKVRQYGQKTWANRDKERSKSVRDAWRAANRTAIRVYQANQRAMRRAGDIFTTEDIEEIFGLQRGRCGYCRTSIKRKYHIDHIIPIARGGGNGRRNIQLLCPRCNMSKHDRHPLTFARELGRLL